MTRWQSYVRIIFPQAVRNAIPATGNTFIGLLKETSLAFTIGVAEMFAQGKMIASANYKYFETYLAVGIVYWCSPSFIVSYKTYLNENQQTLPELRRCGHDQAHQFEKSFGDLVVLDGINLDVQKGRLWPLSDLLAPVNQHCYAV